MTYALRFGVDNIWTIILTNHPEFKPNEVSKDLFLESIVTHDLTIKATIHHTDTVSVMVACSLNPVAVDVNGVVQTFQCLNKSRGTTVTIYRMRATAVTVIVIRIKSNSRS